MCRTVQRYSGSSWLARLLAARLACPCPALLIQACRLPAPTCAAERALNTYCGLHRLLLALCDHHGLWERAEQRLQRFLSCEAHRTKSQAPSLGNLVPLLAVSRQHDWRQVLPVVLSEAVDRQVLWVCKADRTMVSRYKVPPRRGGVDAQLMQVFFEASAVSLRWALPCKQSGAPFCHTALHAPRCLPAPQMSRTLSILHHPPP